MGIEIKLPKFRASYVKLDKPYPVKGSDKEVYSVVALFEPGADIKALKNAAMEALKAKFGDKAEAVAKHPKFKTPFKDQSEFLDEEGNQRPGTVAGATFLNLSHQLKPLILGPNAKEITDHRDFYSGCYAVAKADLYAWDHPVGGKGVTFSLLGIQKVAEGEKLGGTGARAEVSDFEAVEGATEGGDANALFD